MTGVALKRTVGALVAVLAAAAIFFSLDERGQAPWPHPEEISGGGARLLADLLRSEGYVVSELRVPPKKPDPSVAWLWFNTISESSEDGLSKARAAHLEAGGTVVDLPYDGDFRNLLKEVLAGRQRVKAGGRILTVYSGRTGGTYAIDTESLATISSDRDRLVEIEAVDSGRLISSIDGGAFLNRTILEGDNAAFATYLVGLTGKKKIAFVPGSFGAGRPPGLLETLGPGWQAGVYQAGILLLVVGYGLGKRFGLPSGIRRSVRGSRDLPDAIEASLDGRKGARRLAELELRRIERSRTATGDVVRLAELADDDRPDPKAVFAAATKRPEG